MMQTRADVGKLLSALIVVVVFSALIGIVAGNVAGIDGDNLTAGDVALVGLLPTLFILIGVFAVIRFIKGSD